MTRLNLKLKLQSLRDNWKTLNVSTSMQKPEDSQGETQQEAQLQQTELSFLSGLKLLCRDWEVRDRTPPFIRED